MVIHKVAALCPVSLWLQAQEACQHSEYMHMWITTYGKSMLEERI